ncbi:MAG TPA: histidine kinase [Ferruginibacter sp.]|nr:histidine kinase [Ferruginibacter sp.]HPH89600.1 histidine kinase [Ferruginibacter sp.]
MHKEILILVIIFAGTAILTLLGVLIIIFSIRNKYRHQRHRQELLQTQVEIQEQTLKNISEEIHDNIGQVLSLVKLNLNTFPAGLSEEVTTKLDDTELLLSKAINDLRDLSQSMNTDRISSVGLEVALEHELKQIQKTGRFNTKLHVGGNRYALEPQKEMVLFRIVQECLNNSVKHSAAKNIEIELLYRPGSLILQVSDDGKGFSPGLNHPSKNGLGLKNMYNRAALIGAVFSLHSATDNGTTINVELKNTQ